MDINVSDAIDSYTLSLHDALPISWKRKSPRKPRLLALDPGNRRLYIARPFRQQAVGESCRNAVGDRKSTRLNSSHMSISYAVFCLKKKNKSLGRRPADTTQLHTHE